MLRNFEVIRELKSQYGIEILSSQQLNKILEGMGLIQKVGGDWLQTDLGMQFSPFVSKTFRANEWLEGVVDYLAKNLK